MSQESMFDATAGGADARHDGYGEESIAASPAPAPAQGAGAVMPVTHEDQSLPLTSDDFAALEERVLRAVSLVRRERAARAAAEERAANAEARTASVEARLQEQGPVLERLERFDQLEQEVDALKQERDQVRQRVDRLLSQLDALEL